MDNSNKTDITYFILKGFSDIPGLQGPIFLLVLLIYVITLVGNVTILLLICLDLQLQTPMYFFLGNLSVLDMSSTTTALHKVLVNFITSNDRVSFVSCMGQVYVFSCLTCDELLILTAMSYDRYVAICNPLHYPMIMNRTVCIVLAFFSWLLGFLQILPILCSVFGFSCYISNVINHFFCDLVPLITLTCSDLSFLKLYIFIEGGLIQFFTPLLLTFISYVFIIGTILRIRSSTGRRKAFYTCSSHITVVILLYATLFCQYLKPTSKETLSSNKLFSLFNTAAVPLLNPLIYSLKNKDVKSALKRRLKTY
ncbi:olfactory receptor 6C1-like [Discoglossus pictus]